MKRRLFSVLATVLILFSIIPTSTSVYASTVDSVTKVIEVELDSESDASEASKLVNNVVSDVASSSGKKLYLYPSVMQDLSSSERKEAVNDMVVAIRNSNLSSPDKNRASSGIVELDSGTSAAARLLEEDVSSELREATAEYNIFSKYINKVLGFMVYILVVGFTITIFCDISYISVPFIRGLIDLTAKEEGGRPRFLITNEAYRVVLDTEASDSKSIVMVCYIKKMWLPILVLSIVIGYMLRGQIFSFVGSILDLISGIFED